MLAGNLTLASLFEDHPFIGLKEGEAALAKARARNAIGRIMSGYSAGLARPIVSRASQKNLRQLGLG